MPGEMRPRGPGMARPGTPGSRAGGTGRRLHKGRAAVEDVRQQADDLLHARSSETAGEWDLDSPLRPKEQDYLTLHRFRHWERR